MYHRTRAYPTPPKVGHKHPQLHRLMSFILYEVEDASTLSIEIETAVTGDFGHAIIKMDRNTISGDAFEALSTLFQVPMVNIKVETLQKQINGCSTCGPDYETDGRIDIEHVPLFTSDLPYLEQQAKERADEYLLAKELEAQERREEADRQRLAREADAAIRKEARELEKAREAIYINTFIVNKKRIFAKIVQKFEFYQGMDKKTMAKKVPIDDPCSHLFFKFKSLKELTHDSMMAVFEKYTQQTKVQKALAKEFYDVEA